MDSNQINGRIGWLSLILANHRNNIGKILLRLREIGARAGTSLALHRKFMALLEQVAVEREKELDVINEIEAVEKRHQTLRKCNGLRRATVTGKTRLAAVPDQKPEPSRYGVLKMFGLLILFSARPAKAKKCDLTAN